MIADRQGDGPLESAAHRRETLPVRKPVRHDRQSGGRNDVEKAKRRPDADDGECLIAFRERIDDPAEENRLCKLHNGDGDPSEHKRYGERAFRRKHAQSAKINSRQLHNETAGYTDDRG